MHPLATLFTVILAGLLAAIGDSAALRFRDPALADRTAARTALLTRAWHYIGRTAARLERLIALWQAGTLPNPHPARAKRPATAHPKSHFPTSHAWLVATVGYTAAGRASQLNHLLARPDLADFFAAAPQAGRLLRPLCRMLGIDPPPALARPKPPRKPRTPPAPTPQSPAPPPPEPPPPAPPRHGKYPVSKLLRRYSPGKIPVLILRPA